MASSSSQSQSTLNKLLDDYSLLEIQLSIECDEKLFCDLSIEVVFTLPSLAIRLGLTGAEFQQIEKDYEKDYNRQKIEVFRKWRNKNSKNETTYLSLIKAFVEEKNMEAAESVIDFLKRKCPSWTSSHFESVQKPSSEIVAPRHSDQESQMFITEKPQRCSSQTQSTLGECNVSNKSTSRFNRRDFQHNNIFSQAFDFYHDNLVAILSDDQAQAPLDQFVKLVTSNLIMHPIEKEKAQRNSGSIIGCKTLISDVWMFINRASNPERALQRVLSILIQIVRVADIARKVKAKALESAQPGVRCTLLCEMNCELKNKDYGPSATACVSDTQNIVAHDDIVDTCSSIKRYARKLKKYYQDLHADPKWSPAKDILEYVDLVAVSIENESKKEYSLLADLFNVPCGSSVLIEGIPGIGKSTLAYEMCKRWADGIALQKYTLILLLRLRDNDVQCNWSPDKVQKLIGIYLDKQSWKSEAVQKIFDGDGEGLLIILEGFDELPEDKPSNVEVLRVIMRDMSEATIIVTTRTSTTHELSHNIRFKKHIEIQGFNQDNRNRYVKTFFKNNDEQKKLFKQYIDRYPIISGCLYIPLNLAILLDVFTNSKFSKLPKTMTELYKVLIKMLIYREMESEALASKLTQIQNLSAIPDPAIQEAFDTLCKLAYEGTVAGKRGQQQLVFYGREKYKTLGLMKREVKVLPNEGGDMYAYSFLHLTIQEFLAAYYIYSLSSNEIQKHFNKYNNRYKMFVTMRFLAGLTELKGKNLVTVPDEQIYFLHIFHQLMEIKNEALVSQILNQRKEIEVSRVSSVMTEYDFYVLGKCIGLSVTTWRFGFTLRALTDKHMKMLVSGFESVKGVMELSSHPHVKHIGLSLNQLGNDGVSSVLSLPPLILGTIFELNLRATTISQECLPHCIPKIGHFSKLETFLFHDNEFKEGEQQPLIDNLCRLKKLKKVSFSNLSPAECVTVLTDSQSIREVEFYELSLPSIETVLTTLSQCKTLECIEIYQTHITSEVVGRMSMQSLPQFLRELKLNNCAIDSNTACVILDSVIRNKSPALQILDLGDNIIDDKGGCHLADLIPLIIVLERPLNKIFLHHNKFSEMTINKLIDQLAWYYKEMVVYLSLQWEGTVNQIIGRSPIDKCGALKHFKFKRPDMHSCTST
ncbi:PREDICTED: NACHT, LRR and PYD domains-containing protein 5-like [Amphimedon queenslandica]|uniref:NACHT domain-containing protein n=1 Tax=Amphimedon queenslandica TaxID=400682 RepID=A0A1X7T463_AMPQE|nr:PREDICTED: NACHT, LRR and PYD domains-containing protein 5-like [Amphimedon queenslandica]|eukprot:XP_019861440.1 PREDICTED: NACHT, LRR and PYD domains-containing protein 5-like [Amphimedon queenslandica]